MALKCPKCSSLDTQVAVQNAQCLVCGSLFDFDGNLVAPGADASTREAIEARIAPRTVNPVGNLADVQREFGSEPVEQTAKKATRAAKK